MLKILWIIIQNFWNRVLKIDNRIFAHDCLDCPNCPNFPYSLDYADCFEWLDSPDSLCFNAFPDCPDYLACDLEGIVRGSWGDLEVILRRSWGNLARILMRYSQGILEGTLNGSWVNLEGLLRGSGSDLKEFTRDLNGILWGTWGYPKRISKLWHF